MKKAFQYLSYLTSLFLASALAFKVNHYSGEEIILTIAGMLLIVYFPFYILVKSKERSEGIIHALDIALAVAVFFITLGATLKLAHRELGSLFILLGLGSFCLIYSPLLFSKKSKEGGLNILLLMAACIGISAFPLGIFCRVYLGMEWGMQFFTLGAFLLFIVFIPLYLFDSTLSSEEKQNRMQLNYFPIIIGIILFFCIFKLVYPSQNEKQNQATNFFIDSEH